MLTHASFKAFQIEACCKMRKLISKAKRTNQEVESGRIPAIVNRLGIAQAICTEVIFSQAKPGEQILVFFTLFSEIMYYFHSLTSEICARDLTDHFAVY